MTVLTNSCTKPAAPQLSVRKYKGIKMTELIGALLDKVIMIGAGVYAAFIYPSSVKKRVEAGTAKEDEIARLKWIRPVGFGLINYNWFTSGGFQICLIYSPPHFGRHRHP